jgi:predicted NUDIX family NTP pyrophosphohydrolase
MFTFVVPNTNTTGCTLNIDSVGAKALTRDGSTALVAGDLVANSEVVVVYDGTRFQVLNSNSKTNLNLSGTLTVAGNTTLSGGTANGVLYLNGSKVATSGSALTFNGTTFATTGAINSNSNVSVFKNGSDSVAAGPYFQFANAAQTQSYLTQFGASSTYDWWYYNGSSWYKNMTLDAAGNLGLGVVPSAWNASSKAFQYGSNGIAALECFNGANSVMMFNMYRASGGYVYTVAGNNGYRFGIDNSTGFAWTISTGNQGAGNTPTTTTQAMTLNASGQLVVGATTAYGSAGTFTGNGGTIVLNQNSSSSYAGLRIFNELNSSARSLEIDYTGSAYASSPLTGGPTGEQAAIATTGAYPLVFGTTNTFRGMFDASGNLLVGTANTGYTSSNSTYYTPSGSYWINNHASGTAGGTRYIGFGLSTAELGSITQNSTTGVLYNTTSDYRLKTLIAPVTGAGDRLDALNPVEYEWKSDGTRARGFFAHEFQSVYANSVSGQKDGVDEDGNPIYQSMQAGSSEVIADLVAEIKSLRARVAQLEAK